MTKNLNQATKDQIKGLIIENWKTQKPKTGKQLISLIQQTQDLKEKEIIKLLIELENENRINFIKKEAPQPVGVKEYVFSFKTAWYWITIALATVTTIAIFAIPENVVPLVYLRSALGIVFVLFLPGFALIKTLFPVKVPIKTSSENLDMIERVALSFGMSLTLTPMVGLILNYTPWGIRLTSVTVTLLALTVFFATAAMLRELKHDSSQFKRNAELRVKNNFVK